MLSYKLTIFYESTESAWELQTAPFTSGKPRKQPSLHRPRCTPPPWATRPCPSRKPVLWHWGVPPRRLKLVPVMNADDQTEDQKKWCPECSHLFPHTWGSWLLCKRLDGDGRRLADFDIMFSARAPWTMIFPCFLILEVGLQDRHKKEFKQKKGTEEKRGEWEDEDERNMDFWHLKTSSFRSRFSQQQPRLNLDRPAQNCRWEYLCCVGRGLSEMHNFGRFSRSLVCAHDLKGGNLIRLTRRMN